MNGKPTGRRSVRCSAVLLAALLAAFFVIAFDGHPGEAQQAYPAAPLTTSPDNVRAADEAPQNVSGELVVGMKDTAAPGEASSVVGEIRGKGGELVEGDTSPIKTVRFAGLAGRKDLLEEKAKEVSKLPGVEYAEPNALVEMNYVPNDTFFSHPQGSASQGNLSLVGLPKAWDTSKGDGVAVGFADTGLIQGYGELFPQKVAAQTDVLNGDRIADDNHGHGTEVASIAAAKTDNGFGMAGAGFDAKVAMCKFAYYNSRTGVVGGSIADLARCVDWLQKQPSVKVVNLSLDTVNGRYSKALADEVAQTQNRYGKAVVASVGNGGGYHRAVYPASLPGVIGVGSNDSRTRRSSFSNRGPFVDIVAPGNGVVALVGNGEQPILGRGTSFSAPTVAGCAALLYAKGLKLSQVRGRLLGTAVDMGPKGKDTATGYGYLNRGRALAGG